MKAFISYSRWNRTLAERLSHDLRRAGVDVWQDVFSIRTDAEWMPAILQGIEQCDCFVLLASPEAGASPYVARELEEARRLGRKVVPLWIAGKESQLSAEWTARQMIPLRSYWAELPRILGQIGAGKAPAAPEALINGKLTFAELASGLGGGKRFGELTAAPIVPGPYGMAYFAGPTDEMVPIHEADLLPPVALLLRFTGPESDDTLSEAARFLKSQGRAPWFLYVEGPAAPDGRLTIPTDSAHVWSECFDLCERTVRQWAKGRHESMDIFVNAPATLAFVVGARMREMITYRLFNYTRGGRTLYELVYQSGQIA